MIATWTDENGVTHTGSAEGRAYKRHLADKQKAAASTPQFAEGGPVGTVIDGLISVAPESEPAPAAAEHAEPGPVSEPAPAPSVEPRKRSR